MLIPGHARDQNRFQDSWKNSLAFLHIRLQVCAHACGLRLFMDTLFDWVVFFGKNWSRQESCSFAFTVLVAFRAEPIRMASVQTHSCVSQPCPQPVVITCLSCSSLFCLDHTPQDNICGCGEPICELNPAWNVTFKPSNGQTPDVNLAPKSRDVGIQCEMELYELNRGLPPLVWPRDWVADNSDAPEIDWKMGCANTVLNSYYAKSITLSVYTLSRCSELYHRENSHVWFIVFFLV